MRKLDMGLKWGLSIVLCFLAQTVYGVAPTSHPPLSIENNRPQHTVAKVPKNQSANWKHFSHAVGGTWHATWDQATSVPLRIWGSGIKVEHSTKDANVAKDAARQLLANHISLLCPGGDKNDFLLADNVLHNGLRTVGFYQTHKGSRVVGGQVSFRFKNDRLFVIGSEAIGNVLANKSSNELTQTRILESAKQWSHQTWDGAKSTARLGDKVVLPIWNGNHIATFRWAQEVVVRSKEKHKKVRLHVDLQNAQILQEESLIRYADGQLNIEAPIRHPGGNYMEYPAADNNVTIDTQATTTNADGVLTWPGNSVGALEVFLESDLIAVNNKSGAPASQTFSISPNQTVTWNANNDELLDAQLSGYTHTQIVKSYAQTLNPTLSWLSRQQEVNVNIADSCNAFSDGDSINFLVASDQCENTARLADVIYHEFGHSLHANSIIRGAGSFDGSFSEGLSDYLAATITGDPGMGRGFFKNDDPLRHIDPANSENRWPDDVGEVHFTGLIFGGAMWDLRKLLVETYGEAQGVSLADKLYYGAVQRSSTIPTTYVEILAEDDDDGNLDNGTPNICNINASFGRHGLRPIELQLDGLDTSPPQAGGFDVSLTTLGLLNQCPGDNLSEATLSWRLEEDDMSSTQNVTMVENGNRFVGNIPNARAGQTIYYRVDLQFADGSTQVFPNNPADPEYQFYVGEVEEIYCTDFESDPFAESEGWTHGLSAGVDEEGADDWMWGSPQGSPESGDPTVAYSGTGVVGNDLGGIDFNGLYQANKTNWLQSPSIDVSKYSNVRLQYRRWLTVEDAFFDKGTISVNGQVAWTNLNSNSGNSSTTHHEDKEWRFHDVALSDFIDQDNIQIRYSIESDGGLELGGWNIDDFCIVASTGEICGDGQVNGSEECDDGDMNSDQSKDACRTNCTLPICGDSVVDFNEDCDDGNTDNADACPSDCQAEKRTASGYGCQNSSSPAWFGIFIGLAFVLRRKKHLTT